MANSMAARNNAVDAQGLNANPAANWVSLHTSDPGSNGAAEVVASGSTSGYMRQLTIFPVASNGSTTAQSVTINVPAGTTITHWGRWTASSGGQFYMGDQLPQANTYTTAGTYTLAIVLAEPA